LNNPEQSPNNPAFLPPPPLYDYEEGVKKYTKKIYSEILDVISTILPETTEDKEDKLFQPEELKSFHHKQMNTWKQQQLQRSFRGSGAGGRMLSSGNVQSGGGMIGGMQYGGRLAPGQFGQHPMMMRQTNGGDGTANGQIMGYGGYNA